MRGRCSTGCWTLAEPVDLVISQRAARLTLLDETGVGFRDNHWESDLTSWLGP